MKHLISKYNITQKDILKAKESLFVSFEPLKLKVFPRKDKKKIIVLMEIIKHFDARKHYREGEINSILNEVFDDYVTLRRELIDFGFLKRTDSGDDYWVNRGD